MHIELARVLRYKSVVHTNQQTLEFAGCERYLEVVV
jgi:hypothetical protein